jgi:hypothetical protein
VFGGSSGQAVTVAGPRPESQVGLRRYWIDPRRLTRRKHSQTLFIFVVSSWSLFATPLTDHSIRRCQESFDSLKVSGCLTRHVNRIRGKARQNAEELERRVGVNSPPASPPFEIYYHSLFILQRVQSTFSRHDRQANFRIRIPSPNAVSRL